jgi:hypothetical protein
MSIVPVLMLVILPIPMDPIAIIIIIIIIIIVVVIVTIIVPVIIQKAVVTGNKRLAVIFSKTLILNVSFYWPPPEPLSPSKNLSI